MTLQRDLELAHATCPCCDPPWGATRCRTCGTSQRHVVDQCEWRGHAAIVRLAQAARLEALEQIKPHIDRDPAISAEVRKTLQWAG